MKKSLGLGKLLSLLLTSLVSLLSCATKNIESPNYKNGRFQNLEPVKDKTFGELLEFWKGDREEWPDWIDVKEAPKVPARNTGGKYRITWINHASFLIQMGGKNIITDPHYTTTTFPVDFMGPSRVHKPLLAFEDLPAIDYVFISHDHYDHMDSGTIKMLHKKFQPKFLVGLENAGHLRGFGVPRAQIIELDWWQKYSDEQMDFHFVPVQHWSRRSLLDTKKALWGGLVIDFKGFKIYHGGDSGYGKHYLLTKEKLGIMDVALLPIGAYEPRDFMKAFHMNPSDAMQAHIDLEAKKSIGMHFGTFQLTYEAIDDPKNRLERLKKEKQINNFFVPEYGDFWEGDSVRL